MRKELLFLPAAALMVLTGCKDDVVMPDAGDTIVEADKTMYVNLTIRGDIGAATRAASADGNPVDGTDFDKGTGNESTVQNAYFVFYGANGNVVGSYVPINLGEAVTDPNPGNTVESVYNVTVPVELRKNDIEPTQVMCFLNVSTPTDLTKPLYEIQTVTRKEVQREITGNDGTKKTVLPMSNSVHYHNAEGTTSPSNEALPLMAADIKGKLANTPKEALEKGATEIYVERYAAKLALTLDASNIKAYETNMYTYNDAAGTSALENVSLSFVLEKWALNAEADETFVVKSFRSNSTTGDMLVNNYTYGEANNYINKDLATGQWVWNNSNYHRSYWACSPAYFTPKYPEIAADVTSMMAAGTLHQKYYTLKDLLGSEGFTNDGKAKYVRETTVGSRALSGENPNAAVASVILVGHYDIEIGGTAISPTEFYTYSRSKGDNKPYVYFPNKPNSTESTVSKGTSMLRRFMEETKCLYRVTEEGGKKTYAQLNPYDENDRNLMAQVLEVTVPSEEALNVVSSGEELLKVPARYRTLQFKSKAELKAISGDPLSKIAVASGNGYAMIDLEKTAETQTATAITLGQANGILMHQVNFCSLYTNEELNGATPTTSGRAYFSIPVNHYGYHRAAHIVNGKNNLVAENGGINWKNALPGDFGIVRNHSYSVNITAIKGLGTGIADLEDPIVPPADTEEQYVAYKVNILKWAVVPQQNVTLE